MGHSIRGYCARFDAGDLGAGCPTPIPQKLKLIRNPFFLTHGVSLNNNFVGVMSNSVADGVGQGRLTYSHVPTGNIKLGTENC